MKEMIIEAVENYNKIIIHRHVRPDPDALGSQAGLANLVKNHYPNKEVYIVGDEEISLKFIAVMDHIDDDVFQDALIIICDTANVERISDERYLNGDKVIKIDHHPNDDAYGDISWVDTQSSSVSEMIYELFETWNSLKGMKMTEEAARCLFSGIVGDTGRFRYPNTTEKTFRNVSELVKQPFSPIELYEKMEKKSLNDARLEGYILSNFELLDSGVGVIRLSNQLLQQFGVTANDASRLVNTFANVEHVKAWVFFVEEPDGLIRVRLRSKGPIINTVAKVYNGGGHPLAAGATVDSWEKTNEVIDLLKITCNK